MFPNAEKVNYNESDVTIILALLIFLADIEIDNGKPILRFGVDDNDKTTTIQNENEGTNPQWLRELRARIPQLINEHGYRDAKPYIRRLVEETEIKLNVLLHVQGTASIEVGPSFRAKKHKKKLIARDDELENDPLWLQEFKTFMKALVQSYGAEKAQQMMALLITTLEKQHGVVIQDVDRAVLVHYVNKTLHLYPPQEENKNTVLEYRMQKK